MPVNSCKATLNRGLQLNSSELYKYTILTFPYQRDLLLTWSKCEFGDCGTRRLQIEFKLEVLVAGSLYNSVDWYIPGMWIFTPQYIATASKSVSELLTCAGIFVDHGIDPHGAVRSRHEDHYIYFGKFGGFELFMTNFNCTCLLLHKIQSFSDHCVHACWFCFKVCGYSHLNHWKCYSWEIAIYIEQSQGGSECEMDLFCFEMGALESEDFVFLKILYLWFVHLTMCFTMRANHHLHMNLS